jgi:hypothetical protein
MKTMLRASAMLVVTLGLAMLSAAGQAVPAAAHKTNSVGPSEFEMGLTFTYKFAQVSAVSGSRYVMLGESLDGVYYPSGRMKNLGLAFDVSQERKEAIEPGWSNPNTCTTSPCYISPGVGLSQFTGVVGPRFRWNLGNSERHPISAYAQGLFGAVYGYNSYFPHIGAATTTASSLAIQTGGGLNMRLTRNLGLHLLEADYVMTRLPNNANNYQGDLRMSNGITFRF